MSDQLVERRRRSNSMGVSSKPINNPHRVSPINLSSNPPSINKHVLKMSTGSRLRAATSFSPYQSNNPPSSMAIRRTGISAGGSDGFNTDGTFGKPLAAIAGPLGITIVDVNAPQHPWLVLNYSSTTMAFQPCLSTLQQSMTDAECVNSVSYGNRFSNTQSQSPVLLATARGSGILIWDCSGRSLSPLLGRLNASDSSIGASTGNSKTTNSSVGNANGEEPAADPGTINQSQPLPSVKTETNSSDALKSMVGSPKAFERKSSLIRVSSSSSVVAAGATGVPGHALNTSNVTSATATGSLATKTANITSSSKGDVTSLTWKGPSAPILLSTCGTSASAWDLRTSVLSGVGGTGGARPNARFICPEDNLYHADSSLIHCAYSHDELANTFATLDSLGVVRVWDDRKAEQPVHSFLACPGGGVGIASIAPARDEGSGARPRWVSWGIDDEQDYGDDLVAKVWTDLSTNGVDGSNSSDAYRVTSRVSMPGAVAARVHPSCADGIILFRDNPSEKELEAHQMVDGMATTGEMKDVSEGLLRSPNQMVLATGLKMRASPEMVVVQTPPSPPPLMLGEVEMEIEQKQISSSKIHQGWEAELWQIDESGVAIDEGCVGAKKLSVFRGGGDEEDTLSFAPGRGDVSDVVAIDLALGTHNDGDESVNKELSLCVLTKAGRLTVYGVPEASLEGEASEYSPNKRGRVDLQTNMTNSASTQVYRHGADLSPWWNKNEEEHDLFGDTNAAQDSPKKASIEGMRSAADNGLPRMQDSNTKPPIASPSIIPDVNLAVPPMDEMTSEREVDTSAAGDVQQKPIDFSEAARVPCPPLCGVAFSALGKIVSFNNGPVKRMWKYHQSNEPLSSQPRPSFGSLHDDDEDSSTQNQNVARIETVENKVLPRSLGDLIEMTKRAQTLQWGDEQQQNNDSPIDDDGNSTSSSSDDSSTSYDDPDLMVSDSDDSGLASESDGSEGLYHVSSNDSDGMVNVDNMFDDYFASSRKSVLGSEHEGAGQSKDGNFAGLPSLAPSVIITKEYEDIILNGQTPKLANQLKLGDVWWLTKDFVAPDNTSSERPYNSDGQEDNSTFFRNSSDPYLASSSFSEPSLERSSSFSNTTKSKQRLDNSMISKMKLLFANQLPTAMTPPDQRLCKSNVYVCKQMIFCFSSFRSFSLPILVLFQ